MMVFNDPTLFDALVDIEQPATLQERFEQFHDWHPEVFDEIVGLARQAHAAGQVRIGIGMLWEVLRWNRALRGVEDITTGYKLNNSYRSRYARLIMDTHPDLAGIFETRELHA